MVAVGTSFAKALVVPSAYARVIQVVGVEVEISVAAAGILEVGDFCLWL